MQHQASPSATDVQEAIIPAQAQFAANQLKLVRLRSSKIVVRRLEVAARVHQRFAKPWPVGINRLVVVMRDGRSVSLDRVALPFLPPVGHAGHGLRRSFQHALTSSPWTMKDVLRHCEDREDISFDIDVVRRSEEHTSELQ